jgi:lipid A ethanolaminephosphotransferase
MIKISSDKLILTASLYFSTVLNAAFWRFFYSKLEICGFTDAFFVLSVPVLMFCMLWGCFNLLLIRYLTKPLLCLLLLLSATANYAMTTYGIVIDSAMFQNFIETDTAEIRALITLKGCLWLLVTGLLPCALLLITRIEYSPLKTEIKRRMVRFVGAVLMIGLCVGSSYKSYTSFVRTHGAIRKTVNTFDYISAATRYVKRALRQKHVFVTLDQTPVIVDRVDQDQKRLIVLVIGETARAADFSLYGYARNTNPLLQDEELTVFKPALSCGTSTAVSVPCLFSAKARNDFDVSDARYTQNLLDLVQLAGYKVLWLDNDGGCKGVCDRVPTTDLRQTKDPVFCKNGACQDGILINAMTDAVRDLDKDTLLVLHMMGSHGPTYFERYPDSFKRFTPTCDTANLPDCSVKEIVNTYDNTIVYTDYVLTQLIERLKAYQQYQSALLYVSDHGESLGEKNLYLHGLPYGLAPDTQKRVPVLLWLSTVLQQAEHIDMQRLHPLARSRDISHDEIYSTVLHLTGISSTTYRKDLDLLADF